MCNILIKKLLSLNGDFTTLPNIISEIRISKSLQLTD